ncbi:2-octaprenyl-3-methyl-6-methoxy-1,4-benzoquinol hydroxylase [Marinobacterium nitratireducens]|uniref:2-octaprenyl-3-methyl-6-methoxy-1,4-benzoquinol hydroxylase n=1 Tax=Marinobacterium nitratireducens TaxID=518897 RepID=A0A918DX28_9GAMM|nr:FAD-dependent monooxygenase [Marinobacterium nitratireducens]GGO87732.1 2-octaprenyl-3-methyl-6-methoxy-1,4-benzoquinol hydroxylase [Marinobacterium nitratireducens]
MQDFDADVVIVGAGMVGLTAALALTGSGLRILLLESRELDPATLPAAVKAQQGEGFDPRVSALTVASQQIFRSFGAWDAIEGLRLSPYTDMDVWDGEGTGHIHFSAAQLHEPCLGHIVENRVILAGLCDALTRRPDIALRTGVEVLQLSEPRDCGGATGRELGLSDGTCLKARLVIAADGALSRTRQLAALPTWEWDYGHHAIVTTVRTERANQATAWQRFTDDGPLAFLPLCDGEDAHLSSIVWSTSPEHARELEGLDDDAFCRALGRAFEQRLGEVLWSDRRHRIPLRQRHARRYVQESFAAIGDAAHTIHPLAGQGVNLGLLDAAVLAEVLQHAAARDDDIGSLRILRRYQRRRQGDNLQMAATMEGFKRLFGSQQPLLVLGRNIGMSLFDHSGPLKSHLVQAAMGLAGELPERARRPVAD